MYYNTLRVVEFVTSGPEYSCTCGGYVILYTLLMYKE